MIDNSDLLERTLEFSESAIKFLVKLPKNPINNILVRQALRSITSIGANYREACEAESAKDFVHKIRISKKEARESEYWLILISRTNPFAGDKIKLLLSKSQEFIKIFSTISKKFKK